MGREEEEGRNRTEKIERNVEGKKGPHETNKGRNKKERKTKHGLDASILATGEDDSNRSDQNGTLANASTSSHVEPTGGGERELRHSAPLYPGIYFLGSTQSKLFRGERALAPHQGERLGEYIAGMNIPARWSSQETP